MPSRSAPSPFAENANRLAASPQAVKMPGTGLESMPQLVWRRMAQLPLQGASFASEFHDPIQAIHDLQAAFTVLDVGTFRGGSINSPGFWLRSATLAYGELVVSSFRGTALHSHLVSEALAFLVLPGQGIGHYRLLGEQLNVTAGDALGYLPPCEFAITNSVTRGTLIGFTPSALQRRLTAIRGGEDGSARLPPELWRPQLIRLDRPDKVFLLQTILDGLALIDQAVALTAAPPPAALALDDLILRSIALMLAPDCTAPATAGSRSLAQAVDLAMARIRANLERPISLTDIEQQVGYGRRALQMGFRQRVGCGPMQWLRRQRLETAHALVLAIARGEQGPLSLRQVAERCGYINYSAFSRDFSRLHGVTASQLLHRRS